MERSSTPTEAQDSSSGRTIIQRDAPKTGEGQQKVENRLVILPGKKTGASFKAPSSVSTNTLISSQSRIPIQNKPLLNNNTNPVTGKAKNSPTLPVLSGDPPRPALLSPSKESKTSSQHVLSQKPHRQVNAPFLKKSKFTWVKSETVDLEPKTSGSISVPISKVTASQVSVHKAAVPVGSPLSGKKTPLRKFPRKLSPVIVAPKTSKYRWVSSSGVQTKNQRKLFSPKALTVPQRGLERGDAAKKLKLASSLSARSKKGSAASSTSPALVSRYRWKAQGQIAAGSVPGAPTAARRRSAFHWTAEKSNRGLKSGQPSPTVPQRAHLRSSSPGGFKLRSRMKIIRSVSRYIYLPSCHCLSEFYS